MGMTPLAKKFSMYSLISAAEYNLRQAVKFYKSHGRRWVQWRNPHDARLHLWGRWAKIVHYVVHFRKSCTQGLNGIVRVVLTLWEIW